MTRLSVNINKIATLRNSRGGNIPDVLLAARKCEEFGGQGITVHPRPDERHIRYSDVYELRPKIKTEFNIEGYPSDRFIDMVLEVCPDQVTLVPDAPDALTSDHGWNTQKNQEFLKRIIKRFHEKNIRTSIFMDTDVSLIEAAASTGTDRIELYTEPYAKDFPENPEKAIKPFLIAANAATENGLEINAGHDLNLENLRYFAESIPQLKEVSIGHALIADALYFGLEDTIKSYLDQLAF
jgi:pyridoxine 5-phosphate synthase